MILLNFCSLLNHSHQDAHIFLLKIFLNIFLTTFFISHHPISSKQNSRVIYICYFHFPLSLKPITAKLSSYYTSKTALVKWWPHFFISFWSKFLKRIVNTHRLRFLSSQSLCNLFQPPPLHWVLLLSYQWPFYCQIQWSILRPHFTWPIGTMSHSWTLSFIHLASSTLHTLRFAPT